MSMNKYQTVVDKLDKIPKGYTVVVLLGSLDQSSWFVKSLEPYLKKSLMYADYKLYGGHQSIYLPSAQKSIKFVTVDTIDMISSPFLMESETEDSLEAVYTKDLQDYIVIDLPGDTIHSFDKPVNLDEFMWMCRVLKTERLVEGKAPTYELKGLPKDMPLEFTEIQINETNDNRH